MRNEAINPTLIPRTAYGQCYRGCFAPAIVGWQIAIHVLVGAKRYTRTTAQIKLTSAVKAYGFSVLAAYSPPR